MNWEKVKALVTNGWTRKRLLWVALPLAAIIIFGAFRLTRRSDVQYFTAKVERGDIDAVVTATGTINAVTSVLVGSQVSGTIQSLHVDFNSQVKRAQVIAQIDPATFRARLAQAEADLENSVANVKSLEANIDNQRADVAASRANIDRARATLTQAQLNLDRIRELFNQQIFSKSQLDDAQSQYDTSAAGLKLAEAQYQQSLARLKSSQAQLEQAKAQVAQRRAAVDMARVDLDHTTIRAPIDGTVIARNVDVGQTVAASLQAPTLFTIAQDLTKMLVYAKTDESDVGKIRVGAEATFKVDAFPRETFRGRVTQVRMNAYAVQNVVTYDTIIEFSNPETKLYPGMTAYVTIPVASAHEVLKLANGALRFKPDITENERRALLKKYGLLQETPAKAARERTLARSGDQPGAGGGSSAGGGRSRGMGRGGSQGSPPAGAAAAGHPGGATAASSDDIQIVWMLRRDRTLQPVRVRTGITDYTFTELKGGDLKEGDELVIAAVARGSMGQAFPGRPGGGFGPGRRPM